MAAAPPVLDQLIARFDAVRVRRPQRAARGCGWPSTTSATGTSSSAAALAPARAGRPQRAPRRAPVRRSRHVGAGGARPARRHERVPRRAAADPRQPPPRRRLPRRDERERRAGRGSSSRGCGPRWATSRSRAPAHPDAEPVVMLHGLGGTKASFLPTVAALADEYRVARDRPAGLRRLGQAARRRLRPALLRPRGVRLHGRGGDRERAPDRQLDGRPRRVRGRLPQQRPGRTGSSGSHRRSPGCATAGGRRWSRRCDPSSACSRSRRGR